MKAFFILSIIAGIFFFIGKRKNNQLGKKTGIVVFIFASLLLIGNLTGIISNEEIVKVQTQIAKKENIFEVVSASGKIQPEVEVKISPDVSGEIVALTIIEGNKVLQGDLLVKIKPDIYLSMFDRSKASLNTSKANLAKAEAQLTESESNYNRNKILYENDVISHAEYEQIESAFKVATLNMKSAEYAVVSAEASVKEAQENLDKTSIFAPMSGTISRLNVELGERVVGTGQMSGTELLRLANLDAMEVAVEVNENDIVRVHKNDTVIIEVDAFLGETYKGIVSEIANSADVSGSSADQVTNFEVKIRVLNQEAFRPGMTATVDIQTQKVQDIVAVPIQAVTTRKDTSGANKKVECVFVFTNGIAKYAEVKTGIQDANNIQILSGIDIGAEVIIGPYSLVSKSLKDGMTVEKDNTKSEIVRE